MRIFLGLLLVTQVLAKEELIDRIAVVCGTTVIKDSDIDRDIRVTDFLNAQPLVLNQAARRRTAAKLLDQALLKQEIRIGGYEVATTQEANSQLAKLAREAAAFGVRLSKYGIDEADLREHLRWQLTVLRFIDARFKPAAVIEDAALNTYYTEHKTTLKRQHPNDTDEKLHADARDILVGEEVNRLLFSWLDEQRKQTKVTFLEDGLA